MDKKKKIHSLASVITGVLSIALFYLVGVSTILGLVAIGLGGSGRKRAPEDKKNLAGIITGALGVVLSIGTLVLGFLYGGTIIKYLTPPVEQVTIDSSESIEEVRSFTMQDESGQITYSNFMKINLGMTFEEVTQILGEGKKTYENISGDHQYTSYEWNYTDNFYNIYSIVVEFDKNVADGKYKY